MARQFVLRVLKRGHPKKNSLERLHSTVWAHCGWQGAINTYTKGLAVGKTFVRLVAAGARQSAIAR
tara:strand:- start:6356 stop:6553 length:198 start_codon:yes stop_codon:yes gene_type:complete